MVEKMDNSTRIERFIKATSEHINRINGLPKDYDYQVYKKLLFVAIMDRMSKTAFPQKGNRERFISFLKSFSDWKDGERVSLTHLTQLTRKNPDPAFEKIRLYAQKEVMSWKPGDVIHLDKDPDIQDVLKLWPGEKEHRIPLEGVPLESLQHINLLYTYRNFLAHEIRSPAYQLDDENDRHPAYVYLLDADEPEDKGTWILVYPTHFFQELCEVSLKNLGIYLQRNDLNPLQHFSSGSLFIEELNK